MRHDLESQLSVVSLRCAADFRRWAAYVLGHHPHSLRSRLEELCGKIDEGSPKVPEVQGKIFHEVNQMRNALLLLASEELLRPCLQVELHRRLDTFACLCDDLVEQSELRSRLNFPVPPLTPVTSDPDAKPWATNARTAASRSYEMWEALAETARNVLGLSDDLELWRLFGETVGRWHLQRYRNGWEVVAPGFRPIAELGPAIIRLRSPTFEQIEDCAEKTRQCQLEQATDRTKRTEQGEADQRPTRAACAVRYKDVNIIRLHSLAESTLRGEKAREPLLVLAGSTLVFYGESIPLRDIALTPLKCLWVLARHPQEEVEVKQIIEEGKILSHDARQLQVNISRLKRTLWNLLEAHCHKRDKNVDDHPAAETCHIEHCREQGEGYHGAYMLDLDGELVVCDIPLPEPRKPERRKKS